MGGAARLSLLHSNLPPKQLRSVQHLHRRLSLIGILHLHKRKTPRPTRLPINLDGDSADLAGPLKEIAKIVLGGLVGEPPNK